MGNAEIYVSGKITRLAFLEAACLVNDVAFSLVLRALRKTGLACYAATRRMSAMLDI
jgi:hypothetical protein